MFGHNTKKGLRFKIPGFGDRHIKVLLSDYDGTLSCGCDASSEVKVRLARLAECLDIHILTADRKVESDDNLGHLPVKIHILSDKDQDVQKRDYLDAFEAEHVAVMGNGNNDRLLLEAVRTAGGLCIAVDNGEGCAVDALLHAHVFARSAEEALDLLLNTDVCATTLRY